MSDGVASLSGGVATGLKSLNAATLTDGVGSLSGGVATGFRSVSATTLTDGVASLSGGVATGLKSVAATSVSDGVATLANGALTGLKSLSMASTGATSFAVQEVDAQLVSASTALVVGGVNKPGSWRLFVDASTNTFCIQVFDTPSNTYITKTSVS